MDYEFLHSCFPNYTLAMWQGNEPKNQPASKCWKMFHEKAVELFELGDWKGEYRDL